MFERMNVGICNGLYDRDCKQSPTLLFDEANVWCLCGCSIVGYDDEVERRWANALNATKYRAKGSASRGGARRARRASTDWAKGSASRDTARRARQAATDWANNRTSGDSLKSAEGSAQRGGPVKKGAAPRFNDRKGHSGVPPCPASEHRWKLIQLPGDGGSPSYVCVVCATESAW